MKFGIGILTYNNVQRFRDCISHLPVLEDTPIVVVNDGTPYDLSEYREDMVVIQHPVNKKIAKSKNDAVRYLLAQGAEWIFLMEDDMVIKHPLVFERYIQVAELSGLRHMNFALHGTDNWTEHREHPSPRLGYNSGLALYRYAGGCFQLFHRSVFETVGFFDEYYQNCWEHLDLTFRATLAGLHTPFWLAADVSNAFSYIEQSTIHTESTTSTHDVNPHYWDGLYYWKFKYGSWFGETPDWINPTHHTDTVVIYFREHRYEEIKNLMLEHYQNDQGFFFNPEVTEAHIYDYTWARRVEDSVEFFRK